VDIVLNFITPVQDMQRVWVTEPFRIARTYVGGWFTIDIVSIVPFDIISSFHNKRYPFKIVTFTTQLKHHLSGHVYSVHDH
jgi:hypothetical protein